jgi:hypothetical protein
MPNHVVVVVLVLSICSVRPIHKRLAWLEGPRRLVVLSVLVNPPRLELRTLRLRKCQRGWVVVSLGTCGTLNSLMNQPCVPRGGQQIVWSGRLHRVHPSVLLPKRFYLQITTANESVTRERVEVKA